MAMQRKRRRRSGGNNNNNPNRHFDSNGPDVRIRGSAQQVLEKYLQYARDAQTAGDRVKAEGLFQHAEHYARIVATFERQKDEERREREEREARRSEDRSTHQENSDDGQDAADDAEDADGTETADDNHRPKRRGRRPAADSGAEADSGKVNGADTQEETEDSGEDKPRRRRRNYARKSESDEISEGVLKTIARGTDASEDAATEKSDA